MSDNINNVHFLGVRFISSPYLSLKIGPCFAQADNGKMRATNESYALKMNIIVILQNWGCYSYGSYRWSWLLHLSNQERRATSGATTV